jgi:hypothetical protein
MCYYSKIILLDWILFWSFSQCPGVSLYLYYITNIKKTINRISCSLKWFVKNHPEIHSYPVHDHLIFLTVQEPLQWHATARAVLWTPKKHWNHLPFHMLQRMFAFSCMLLWEQVPCTPWWLHHLNMALWHSSNISGFIACCFDKPLIKSALLAYFLISFF